MMKAFVFIAVITTEFFMTSRIECRAQGEMDFSNLTEVTLMPTNGIFWSLQLTNFPPSPFDPFPDAPLWTDGLGNYFYYFEGERHGHHHGISGSLGGGITADDSPPVPGSGDGSTNGSPDGVPFPYPAPFPGSGYTNCETWTNFYLLIDPQSNVISITITNTLPGLSYNLIQTTNLAEPFWIVLTNLTANGYSITISNFDVATNEGVYFAATSTSNDAPPLITVPPSNQVVFLGDSTVLFVNATGFAPLTYQWQFNGTNISGATTSALTLADIQSTNAGTYTVIVSNVLCTASAEATLSVSEQEVIPNNPFFTSTSFGFDLTGTFGSSWTIYASSDLENWGPVGNVSLTNSPGTNTFTDSWAAGFTTRFYEAVSGTNCSQVIGYSFITLAPGTNLVANQFFGTNAADSPQNTSQWLSDFLFGNDFPSLPNLTEILKWNETAFSSNTWLSIASEWTLNGNLTFLPGQAVYIINPTTNTVTVPFAGWVAQGILFNPIVAGTNYLSSTLPFAGRLQSDLGFQPHNGDWIQTWNGGYPSNYTYSGSWSPSEPFLAVGQGFLLVTSNINTWFQTNLSHTGSTSTLTELWSYNVTNLDSNNYAAVIVDASPAIGTNGTVYLPSSDNLLFAFNPASGNVFWADSDFVNTDDQEITSSAALSQDGRTIYFGTASGFLVAVTNILTQAMTTWSNSENAPIYSTPALSPNGGIFAGSDDGPGGTGIWGYSSNGTDFSNFCQMATNLQDVDSSVAIGADLTLYFLSEGGRIPLDFMALSPNGSVNWLFPVTTVTDNPSDPSCAIDTEGTIYATGRGQYLYAINPDGSPKWAFDTAIFENAGGGIPFPGTGGGGGGAGGFDFVSVSSPIVDSNHTVYAASARRVFAVTNGVLKWAFPDPSVTTTTLGFEATPVLDEAGNVYIGETNGTFWDIGSDGQLVGFFQASSKPIISSAVIGTNDVIYFASADGVVHALEIPYGPASNLGWPMFQQNARHAGYQPEGPDLAHTCGAPFPFDPEGSSGTGQFEFSFVGVPGSTWTVYQSTNFTSWSTNGATITVPSGAGPQIGSFTTYPASGVSNQFLFMTFTNSTSVTNVTNSLPDTELIGCCSKAIGFIEVTLQPGTNLIADPLYQADSSILFTKAPNTLASLMNPSSFEGVEVDEWNGQGFDDFTNNGGAWFLDGMTNGDGSLRPGQSALIVNTNTSAITFFFVGLVRDGAEVGGMDYLTNYITLETNYLGSMLPLGGGISTALNFPASHGDQIQLWTNGTNFSNFTYTNTCSGTNWAWCPSEPVLQIGQGFILITTNINKAWVQSLSPCY